MNKTINVNPKLSNQDLLTTEYANFTNGSRKAHLRERMNNSGSIYLDSKFQTKIHSTNHDQSFVNNLGLDHSNIDDSPFMQRKAMNFNQTESIDDLKLIN